MEPPYGIIWNQLKKGKAVVFLGAGASLCGRAANDIWCDGSAFLPKGWELSNRLAEESQFPLTEPHERSDLPKVASFYQAAGDRASLRACLRGVFSGDYKPGPLHQFWRTSRPRC
jgi:hypothetical protein